MFGPYTGSLHIPKRVIQCTCYFYQNPVIKFSQNETEWRSTTCLAFHHLQLSLYHLTMPFGQLIFRKVIELVATRGQILRLKCIKFYFSWGSASDRGGEAYIDPLYLLAEFKEAYF